MRLKLKNHSLEIYERRPLLGQLVSILSTSITAGVLLSSHGQVQVTVSPLRNPHKSLCGGYQVSSKLGRIYLHT
jgi:hypothetical protein